MGSIFPRGKRLYINYKTVGGAWKQRPTDYVVGQENEAKQFLAKLEKQVEAAVALGAREEGPLTVKRYGDKWIERRRLKASGPRTTTKRG